MNTGMVGVTSPHRMMRGAFILLLSFGLYSAQAQWTAQTITMGQGWNAVYLQVSPELMCHALFTGTPVKVIQQFNPSLSAQYETSPACPLRRAPEWLSWHSGESNALPPTLFALRAGQAYLMSNDAPFTLVLTGRVERTTRTWRPDDWHLTGFDVAPNSGLTFARYFGADLDHIATLQRVDSNGVSRTIASDTPIEANRAYWIKTSGRPTADGPLQIEGAVWLNASDATATLTLSNHSTSATNIFTFTLTDSLPAGGTPVHAVSLMRWIEEDRTYHALPVNTGFDVELPPLASAMLVFKVNPDGLVAGQTCHSLLRVSGGGLAYTLPVTYVHDSFGAGRSAWPYGLWAGKVSLSEVSFVGENDSALAEVKQPMDIRLILHHGTNGELRLLSRVIGVLETNEQGSVYRLYTDERKLPNVAGRDVFRISSPAFGMMPPLLLSGSFLGAQPAAGSWTLPAQDPLNPYRHVFHHDLKEGFAISNEITFTWTDGTNAPLISGTAWNPNGYCIGTCEQRISGLRHQDIRARGTFQLEWISGTGTLE